MFSRPPPTVAETFGGQSRFGFVTRALDRVFRVHELRKRYSRIPTCVINVGEVIIGDGVKAVGWGRPRQSLHLDYQRVSSFGSSGQSGQSSGAVLVPQVSSRLARRPRLEGARLARETGEAEHRLWKLDSASRVRVGTHRSEWRSSL
jgi:hypothetical protein